MTGFTKNDSEKYKPNLECVYAREAVIEVLTYGGKKYGDHNWKSCTDWTRYANAADRHSIARKKGEEIDPDSGCHHLAHEICSLMYLLEKELNPDIAPCTDSCEPSAGLQAVQIKWSAPPESHEW